MDQVLTALMESLYTVEVVQHYLLLHHSDEVITKSTYAVKYFMYYDGLWQVQGILLVNYLD